METDIDIICFVLYILFFILHVPFAVLFYFGGLFLMPGHVHVYSARLVSDALCSRKNVFMNTPFR